MTNLTCLRTVVSRMTQRPWFARVRFLSRAHEASTMPTDHVGLMAERDDADGTAMLANHADALIDLWAAAELFATARNPDDDHRARQALLAAHAKLESLP